MNATGRRHRAWRQDRSRVVMIAGITSLVLPCLPIGILAWVGARSELNAIDAGHRPVEGRGQVQAGLICAQVGTLLSLAHWVFKTAVMHFAF